MLPKDFRNLSRKIEGYFEDISRTFQRSFIAVLMKFSSCFKKVSRVLLKSVQGVIGELN